MTLTRRTHCMDHNGIVHIASRIHARGRIDAYSLCGRDMPVQSYWTAGSPGAPALVTCQKCLAEANARPPRAWSGELFDAAERKEN